MAVHPSAGAAPVGRPEVAAAAARIAGWVRQTPTLALEGAALGLPDGAGPVVLKLELAQHTASFKPRGAFNRVLAAAEEAPGDGRPAPDPGRPSVADRARPPGPGVPEAGVIAASGGNHGLGVAYAARRLGLRAEIFVPRATSPVKLARLRSLGAEVHVAGDFYADALLASAERAAVTGALVVHAYDQPEVVAGQGTLASEVERQCPEGLDTVLVAVGGGGLVGGVAAWFDGRARVVGVEPERIPTLHAALAHGGPVDVDVSGVAADSLGARRIGAIAFEVARRTGVQGLLVSDAAILAARQRLWDECRVAAEAGGATAVAALTSGAYRPAPGERVAAIVCGGNTDPSDLVPR